MSKQKKKIYFSRIVSLAAAIIMVVTMLPMTAISSRADVNTGVVVFDIASLSRADSDFLDDYELISYDMLKSSDGYYVCVPKNTLKQKDGKWYAQGIDDVFVLCPADRILNSITCDEKDEKDGITIYNEETGEGEYLVYKDVYDNIYDKYIIDISLVTDHVITSFNFAANDMFTYARCFNKEYEGSVIEMIPSSCMNDGIFDLDSVEKQIYISSDYSRIPVNDYNIGYSIGNFTKFSINGEAVELTKGEFKEASNNFEAWFFEKKFEAGKVYDIEYVSNLKTYLSFDEVICVDDGNITDVDWPNYIDDVSFVNDEYVVALKNDLTNISIYEINALLMQACTINIPDNTNLNIIDDGYMSINGAKLTFNLGKNSEVHLKAGFSGFNEIAFEGEGKVFFDDCEFVGKDIDLLCDASCNYLREQFSGLGFCNINISNNATLSININSDECGLYYLGDGMKFIVSDEGAIDIEARNNWQIDSLFLSNWYVFNGKIVEIKDGTAVSKKKYIINEPGVFLDKGASAEYIENDNGCHLNIKALAFSEFNAGENCDVQVTEGVGFVENNVYSFVEGETVKAKLLPKESYHFKKDAVKIEGLAACTEPGVYEFTVTSEDIDLTNAVEKKADESINESKAIKDSKVATAGLCSNGSYKVVTKDAKESDVIKKAVGDKTIIANLEFEISNVICNIAGDDWNVPVTKLAKPMDVVVTLKDTDAGKKTYEVYKLVDGKAVKVDSTYDSKLNTVSFKADALSAYTIVYDDKASGSDPDNTPEVKPAKKGKVLVDKKTGNSYKVTSSSKKNPTVAFVKTKNKKVKSVTVPKTVTINKVKYSVTTIGAKAFAKCTKLTKVTIPASIKGIGKGAFTGCKKLKSVVIKTTKLTKKNVKAGAFKGIPAKAKVKVPKKSLKNYKKFFFKKGLAKKAKLVK